ncbi:hypothetical protein EPO34_01790 [Patescibacteria group bacterium]|nr:MAG: hypothetical protein EPO34_01790 [Patescibacteria group bacterium]
MTRINYGDDDVRIFVDSAEGNAVLIDLTPQEREDAIRFNNLPPDLTDVDLSAFVDELFDGVGSTK